MSQFDDLLEQIAGSRLNWTLDEIAPSQQFVKLIEAESWHTTEGLGDGLVSLLSIVDALYELPNRRRRRAGWSDCWTPTV
jgi:hypothetical protein